jgi:hypothetical protein
MRRNSFRGLQTRPVRQGNYPLKLLKLAIALVQLADVWFLGRCFYLYAEMQRLVGLRGTWFVIPQDSFIHLAMKVNLARFVASWPANLASAVMLAGLVLFLRLRIYEYRQWLPPSTRVRKSALAIAVMLLLLLLSGISG